MSCVLRISGVDLNINELVDSIDLPFEGIYLEGQPKSKLNPDLGIFEKNGCSLLISSAGFSELPTQHSDSEKFLTDHLDEIIKLSSWPNVDLAVLDFGTEINPETVSKYIGPPKNLIKLIVKANLDIEYSVYRCSEEHNN